MSGSPKTEAVLRANELRKACQAALSEGRLTVDALKAEFPSPSAGLQGFLDRGWTLRDEALDKIERLLRAKPAELETKGKAEATPAKAALSNSQRQRVRVHVKKLLAKEHKGSVAELARAHGLRAADVRAVVDGRRAPSAAWRVLRELLPPSKSSSSSLAKPAPVATERREPPTQQVLPFFEQTQFPPNFTATDLAAKWSREAIAFVLQMSNQRGGSQ